MVELAATALGHRISMNEHRPNPVLRLLLGLWRLVNGTRIVILNVLFFGFLLIFLSAATQDSAPVIQDQTSLVIDPSGIVVEQYASDPIQRAIDEATGQGQPEVLFRDLLAAVEHAADDGRIAQLVLDLDSLLAIGPAQMHELARTIQQFKETSGKPVLAYTEGMAQDQYFLAATADEVWMHPEGLVLLEGYGVYRNYYKELLDKLDVDIHLFRVGEYKSAAEPYVRNDMSPESREANRFWLSGLFEAYLDEVAEHRDMERTVLQRVVEQPADLIEQADGSMADMALTQTLIDRIGTRSEFEEHVAAGGAPGRDGVGFRRIGFEAYAEAAGPVSINPDKVAIVVAQGPILFGEQPPGTVGGDSIVQLLRDARSDPRVKAIVLRVDSPGGAVLPSEKIRAEVETVRDAGTPVVVSMGTVAASGGYWISMSADEIVAEPTTITGSIGIFGMIASIPESLARIGVYTDGVGTAPLAGAFRIDRPLAEEAQRLIQLVIEDGYRDFISQVASARGLEESAVDAVARGRVWTGAQALERGLVDRLGGLNEAVAVAAGLAGVEDPGVLYFEEKLTPFEAFMLDLAGSARAAVAPLLPKPGAAQAIAGLADNLPPELSLLLTHPRDRLASYAYCFCRP